MIQHNPRFVLGYRLGVEEILGRVRAGEPWGRVAGELVRLHSSWRLRVFAAKGVECCSCRRSATHFDVTCDRDTRGVLHAHLNLMSGEVLMTIDHLVPRSKGGGKHFDNLRPMCQPCNVRKGDELPV